jgi:hypothetical protein
MTRIVLNNLSNNGQFVEKGENSTKVRLAQLLNSGSKQ